MWSAPKQPFVLPVRIRSFEELYEQNVVFDKNTKPFEDSAASEIRKKSEERDEQLAKSLFEIMKVKKLSLQVFEDDGLTGIYYGQLFYLLQEVKKQKTFSDEVRKEDQLYIPVLSKLFGGNVVLRKGKHGDKEQVDFYCAPTEKWQEKFSIE